MLRQIIIATMLLVVYWAYAATRSDGLFSRQQNVVQIPGFELPIISATEQADVKTLRVEKDKPLSQPMIVNFWATWCTICIDEFPVLDELHNALGDRVKMVGIAVRDERDAIIKSSRADADKFTVLEDRNGTVASMFEVEGLPQTFVIDGQGKILRRIKGVVTAAQIEDIKKLM